MKSAHTITYICNKNPADWYTYMYKKDEEEERSTI